MLPANVYVGRPKGDVRGKASYLVILWGGAQFGRPAAGATVPRLYSMTISAFVFATDRAVMLSIADELAARLYALRNVMVLIEAEEQEGDTSYVEIGVLAPNTR